MTKSVDPSNQKDLSYFDDLESVKSASGGRVYEIKGVKNQNAVIVELPGNPPQYALFCKVGYTNYKGVCDKAHGGNLRKDGLDADHLLAKNSKQVSNRQGYVRMARVESSVNSYHGTAFEKRAKVQHHFSHASRGDGLSNTDTRSAAKAAGLGKDIKATQTDEKLTAQERAKLAMEHRQKKTAEVGREKVDWALFGDSASQDRLLEMKGDEIEIDVKKEQSVAQKISPDTFAKSISQKKIEAARDQKTASSVRVQK